MAQRYIRILIPLYVLFILLYTDLFKNMLYFQIRNLLKKEYFCLIVYEASIDNNTKILYIKLLVKLV
jgi:hypothetical protein